MSDYETDVSDPDGARTLVNRFGGCIVRGLLPCDRARKVGSEMGSVLIRHGWSSTAPDRPIPEDREFTLDDAQRQVLADCCLLPDVQQAPHDPIIQEFFKRYFEEPSFLQPIILPRVVPPSRQSSRDVTAPHQDYLHNQGSRRTTTVWLALSACNSDTSALEFAPGTHQGPIYPAAELMSSDFAGRFGWIGGQFEPGDALLFSAVTVHRARANSGKLFRLSMDFRFQPLADPICEVSIAACYSNGLRWERIYADLTDRSIRYYWRRRSPSTVLPWDRRLSATEYQLDVGGTPAIGSGSGVSVPPSAGVTR